MQLRRSKCSPRTGDVVRLTNSIYNRDVTRDAFRYTYIVKEKTEFILKLSSPLADDLRLYELLSMEDGRILGGAPTNKYFWIECIKLDPFLTAAARAKRSWRGRTISFLTWLKNTLRIRHA